MIEIVTLMLDPTRGMIEIVALVLDPPLSGGGLSKGRVIPSPTLYGLAAGEFGFVYCREREPRKRAAESHQDQG